jgi:hypothetical protein
MPKQLEQLAKSFRRLLGVATVILFSANAYASGALEAIVAPMSFGAPTATFPNAYSGTGIGIQADYFLNNTRWAFNLGFVSQGAGEFESLRARYYLIGHPQLAGPSNLESVKVESRSRGFYAEAGIAPYQISETTTSPTSTVQSTTAGFGFIGAIGIEQPFFWGSFLGIRADVLSSVGGSNPFSVMILEVSVGIPIAF